MQDPFPQAPSRPRFNGWKRACAMFVLCLPVALACAAEATRPEAMAALPNSEHRIGKFVFAELATPDLAAAKRFYGGMFGWTFRAIRDDGNAYAEASLDGELVAGISQRPLRPGRVQQPSWLSVLAVADVDAARALAVAQGARVLVEPHTHAGRGRAAVLADPQGAVFGILASSSADPPDELAAPGEWIWRTLFTRDHDAAAAFYQNLFDFEVFYAPQANTTSGAPMQSILASGGFARASANGLTPAGSSARPHWLGYVRVLSASAAVARAVELGGKVLLAPRPDRHGGLLAVVADPQGAPVGLMEWHEAHSAVGAP